MDRHSGTCRTRPRASALGLAVLTLLAIALTGTPDPARATAAPTTYPPSDAPIANPDRGFYRHQGDCDKVDFDPATLTAYRTDDHITLVMCVFYLAEFTAGPISDGQLARLDRQADAARTAGLKMIMRFAYTMSEAGDDAPLPQVLHHLDQLRPFFARHRDVIAVVQSGFVGAWGEGYYTQNYGNLGAVTPADWANRKAIVDKLLQVVPDTRMVQVRTPTMKRQMYGPTPATDQNAHTGAPVARVGHHNDCFLSSDTDAGTYQDPTVEYPYLAEDTRHVAMGGETCRHNPPRSQCATAVRELNMFHYSYLNRDYATNVIDDWIAGGCYTDVQRRLGYRFTLVSASTPTQIRRGQNLPIRLEIRNDGWASPTNPRPVKIILRHVATGTVRAATIAADPRRWPAGATVTIQQTVPIAGIRPGAHELLLSLPGGPGVANRPEYAIQVANPGLWEPSTGYNRLLRTVFARP